jgi:hypothetical protein
MEADIKAEPGAAGGFDDEELGCEICGTFLIKLVVVGGGAGGEDTEISADNESDKANGGRLGGGMSEDEDVAARVGNGKGIDRGNEFGELALVEGSA